MPYYVYILVCKDGTFYTGYTRSVKTRLRLHKSGKGAKYLKTHPPDKVVYLEKFETRSQAMKRERAIKRLTHAQKLKLIKLRKKKTA
jgi:putative endonuclease